MIRALAFAIILLPFSSVASAEDYDVALMRAVNARVVPTDPSEIKLVHAYGKCIADRTSMRGILNTLPESSYSDRWLFGRSNGNSDCAKVRPKRAYSPMNYRGPVAEVLFVADFAVAQATRARRNIRVFARPTDAELQQLSPFSRAATLMVEVGECVARADRESARALILSDVGDDQEKQAFSALTPSLSGCIPPGFELKISKFQLRGYIAEGAYRAAVTTQGV